jgi:hypothetical protein
MARVNLAKFSSSVQNDCLDDREGPRIGIVSEPEQDHEQTEVVRLKLERL